MTHEIAYWLEKIGIPLLNIGILLLLIDHFFIKKLEKNKIWRVVIGFMILFGILSLIIGIFLSQF